MVFLDGGLGAEHHTSAACLVGLAHAVVAVDNAAAREIGCFDMLHQLVGGDFVVVDKGYAGVYRLGKIMWSHIGGHTHGDTGGTVHQKVGETCGQHHGFFA